MFQGRKISLVIPCYNEEEGLPHVLAEVPASVDEVIVVDNNSTDRTSEIANDSGVTVIREIRKGYGRAYKTGFDIMKGDIIVTMDGDGTYPADEIDRLVGILLDEELDFISACRFPLSDGKVMDPVSKFGNGVLTFLTRLLFGNGLKDSQSGMWVFKHNILETVNPRSDGMPFSEEIKIKAIRRGLKFREIHIPYRARFGEKKIKKFRDGIRNVVYLLRMRLST